MCALIPPFKADDMQELYKKVLKGSYPQIPTHFSMDLRNLLKAILVPVPADRPTTDQILAMKIVEKRIRKYFNEKDGFALMFQDRHPENILIKTFLIQRNIFNVGMPLDHFDEKIKYYDLGGWGKMKATYKGSYEVTTTEVQEERFSIKKQVYITETVENQYQNVVKVNHIHRSKNGRVTNADISQGVQDNQDDINESERKKALLKHYKVKDHDDLGELHGKLGQINKDQNFGFQKVGHFVQPPEEKPKDKNLDDEENIVYPNIFANKKSV